VRRDVAVHEAEELPVLAAQLVGGVQAVGGVGADARGELGRHARARSSARRMISRSGSPWRYSMAIQ
jgi:hypothetical protein